MTDKRAEEGMGGNDDAGRNGTIVSARNDSNRRLLRSQELVEQLLPGLPNEITIDLITPTLPWEEIVSTMSSVSRAWHGVIQSHEVYDARVRSHSTEKFVIISRFPCSPSSPDITRYYPSEIPSDKISIALYSPRENKSCYLPSIPHLRGGFPAYCRCISLHGKIYILGGEDEFHRAIKMGLYVQKKVYVLDLYGQRRWKECASMEYPRKGFGCGVFDGKIYVFGGYCFGGSIRESEMYDPEVDAWFPISSLPSSRCHHQVATVGEKLFVYGGNVFKKIIVDDRENGPHIVSRNSREDALFLEVYNPAMDAWSSIDTFNSDRPEQVVFARGKFYSIDRFYIHAYDIEENTWEVLHTCSFPTIGPNDDDIVIICIGIVAVDDELFLRVVYWNDLDISTGGSCLLQSRGFGSENKTIVWENAEGSPRFGALSYNFSDFISLAEL